MPPELKTKIKDMTKVKTVDYTDHFLIDNPVSSCRTISYQDLAVDFIKKLNLPNIPSGSDPEGFKTEFQEIITAYTNNYIKDNIKDYIKQYIQNDSYFKRTMFEDFMDKITSNYDSSRNKNVSKKFAETMFRDLQEYTDSTPDNVDSVLMYDDDSPYLKKMTYSNNPYLFGIKQFHYSSGWNGKSGTKTSSNNLKQIFTVGGKATPNTYYTLKSLSDIKSSSRLFEADCDTYGGDPRYSNQLLIINVSSSDNGKYYYFKLHFDYLVSSTQTPIGCGICLKNTNKSISDINYNNVTWLARILVVGCSIVQNTIILDGWYMVHCPSSYSTPALWKV